MLKEQYGAQDESITSLEEAIEDERRAGKMVGAFVVPKAIQPLVKAVQDQRKVWPRTCLELCLILVTVQSTDSIL